MNIAEILKYCPKETKFYSPLFGEVTLFEVTEDKIKVYSIIKSALYKFNYDGTFGTEYTSVECMLFPSKDQRDWSKFRLPVKKGDIMMNLKTKYAFITSGEIFNIYPKSICGINALGNFKIGSIGRYWTLDSYIPASEEAKKELFDKMTEAGYRWNADTLELEKIEPKFKEGDVVVDSKGYLILVSTIKDSDFIAINAILYKNGTLNTYHNPTTVHCITEVTLASIEDRNKFYSALVREGYKYDKEQHKLIKQEFKPYDKVLVRDDVKDFWKTDIYLSYVEKGCYHYRCTTGHCRLCIPYEGNEYLLGTTDSPT